MFECFRKRESKCCNPTRFAGGQSLALNSAPAGQRFKVTAIDGGRHLCARMAAMGIYPGAEMELVCAGCGSPCLIRVHGGTLSLGAGVSDKILVTAVA
jgi:ferrous iron transport protein A